MANAIKKISVQRGYDVTEYALNCFGCAGGQHACLIADTLGMETRADPSAVRLCSRPMAWGSPTSARSREQSVEAPLDARLCGRRGLAEELARGDGRRGRRPGRRARRHRDRRRAASALRRHRYRRCRVRFRRAGDDARGRSRRLHRQRFGFVSPEKAAGHRGGRGRGRRRRRRDGGRTRRPGRRRASPTLA